MAQWRGKKWINGTEQQRCSSTREAVATSPKFPSREIRTGRAHLWARPCWPCISSLPSLIPLPWSGLVASPVVFGLSLCLLALSIYPVDRRRCSDLPVCSSIESQRFGGRRRRGKQSERAHLFLVFSVRFPGCFFWIPRRSPPFVQKPNLCCLPRARDR